MARASGGRGTVAKKHWFDMYSHQWKMFGAKYEDEHP
jgi:hypothetical protein